VKVKKRIAKLVADPGFRAAPLRVLARGAVLAGLLALKREPEIAIWRGAGRVRMPADMRYTTVSAYLLRDWAEPELHELGQLLQPGDVFVDVGANIGLYAVKAAELVGKQGRVIALEPGREVHRRLENNIALNGYGQVELIRGAASDSEGEADLFHTELGNDPQAFSLIPSSLAKKSETVKIHRLDTLVRDRGLARLDLIKIDVEGAEPKVLAGCSEILATLKPAILFEANAYLYAGGADHASQDAWALLAAAGYRFFYLRGRRYQPIDRLPTEKCNVLAVHPESRQISVA
jgi:FkbM family methyltransferase